MSTKNHLDEENIQETLSDYNKKLIDLTHKVADIYNSNKDMVKEKAVETGDHIVKYVKDNPWKALGIGVAAGIIISKVVNSKK